MSAQKEVEVTEAHIAEERQRATREYDEAMMPVYALRARANKIAHAARKSYNAVMALLDKIEAAAKGETNGT